MPALMVQGVSSNAGKSLLVTALCRWSSRQGMRVAPFKAQNMSNNARVVDGGEIGTAQWLQALAAAVQPDVRMNPVLLKPESETTSQVVVRGVVDHQLTARAWRDRSAGCGRLVTEALSSLADEFDVVIVEGAGSPAETNLWANDIVNMAVADHLDAPVALVADIDRGGAFAHLFGTWALLPAPWQRRIEGFVLNKFRGDPDLLAPAPDDLEATAGVPTVGVIPWLDHRLPAEEGPTVLDDPGAGRRVSIVCGPYASNLDEFVQLQQVAAVTWVRAIDDLRGADLIILPGSKQVTGDLDWLRRSRLAPALVLAAAGRHAGARHLWWAPDAGASDRGHRRGRRAGRGARAPPRGDPVPLRQAHRPHRPPPSGVGGSVVLAGGQEGDRLRDPSRLHPCHLHHGDRPGRVRLRPRERPRHQHARCARGPRRARVVHRRRSPRPRRHAGPARRCHRRPPGHRVAAGPTPAATADGADTGRTPPGWRGAQWSRATLCRRCPCRHLQLAPRGPGGALSRSAGGAGTRSGRRGDAHLAAATWHRVRCSTSGAGTGG